MTRNLVRNVALGGPTAALLVLIATTQLTMAYPGDVFVARAPLKGPPHAPVEVPTGTYSVSPQTGAVQYSFPIPVPPGRNGMAPTLALSYSSQNPVRGGIAVGWVLEGIPYIEVDTSQGRLGARTYRSTLAGGQRLVPVTEAGPTGMTQAYRAESDNDFVRYQNMGKTSTTMGSWRPLHPNLTDPLVS